MIPATLSATVVPPADLFITGSPIATPTAIPVTYVVPTQIINNHSNFWAVVLTLAAMFIAIGIVIWLSIRDPNKDKSDKK